MTFYGCYFDLIDWSKVCRHRFIIVRSYSTSLQFESHTYITDCCVAEENVLSCNGANRQQVSPFTHDVITIPMSKLGLRHRNHLPLIISEVTSVQNSGPNLCLVALRTMERSHYEPVENNAISPLGANNFSPDADEENLSMRIKGDWAPEINCTAFFIICAVGYSLSLMSPHSYCRRCWSRLHMSHNWSTGNGL